MKNYLVITITLLVAMAFSQVRAAGDPEAGKTKSANCAACHGVDGNSVNPEWPKLAGQHEGYIVKQLLYFSDGERDNSTMKGMTRCWNVTRAPTPAPPTPAPDTGGTVAPKPTPQPTPQDEGFPSNYKKKVCHASRCSGGGGDIPPVIDAVAHEPYHKCGYDRKWKKCVCWCWYPPQTKMEREDRDDDHD